MSIDKTTFRAELTLQVRTLNRRFATLEVTHPNGANSMTTVRRCASLQEMQDAIEHVVTHAFARVQ